MQSTITSKGQVTVPVEIREKLNLQTGDKLDFQIENGAIRAFPVGKGSLEELMSILPKSTRRFSVEEMNEAIARGVCHGGT
jgi:antitoxin PrlF